MSKMAFPIGENIPLTNLAILTLLEALMESDDEEMEEDDFPLLFHHSLWETVYDG